MDTATLTNTFVANIGAVLAPSEPAATPNAEQFSADNSLSINAPDTTAPDNITTDVQNEPISKPPEDFSRTLREKTELQEPQKGQDEPKLQTDSLASKPASAPDYAQSASAQESSSAPAAVDKSTVATIDNMAQQQQGAKTAQKSALLLTAPETVRLLWLPAQASKQTDTKPGPTGSATPKPEKTLAQSTIGQGQIDAKSVLPDSSKTADIQLGQNENADKDKALAATRGLTNQKGSKELISQALNSVDKTAAAQKPVITGTSNASGSEKAPLQDSNLPAVLKKTSDPQQKVFNDLENPAPGTEKTTNNKADAEPQGQTFAELSDANGKNESLNPSGESLIKNPTISQGQIDVGQAKNHGSSTSKNPGSEQTLLPNNAQTPIAEQPFVSATAGKAAGNVSTTNVAQNVNQQIHEAIHSSIRQGDQQITIRLNPPELGKIFIKFQEQGDQITGLLEVSKAQTRVEIQQALPQIIRALQDSGIQIKRLEVVTSNTEQPEQQAYNGQSLQQGQGPWSDQQGRADPAASHHDDASANEWFTNNSGYLDISEQPHMYVTSDSINILI